MTTGINLSLHTLNRSRSSYQAAPASTEFKDVMKKLSSANVDLKAQTDATQLSIDKNLNAATAPRGTTKNLATQNANLHLEELMAMIKKT